MKYLLIILDGGGDLGKETPLSLARKPNMDSLAKSGIVGSLDLWKQQNPDSDIGYLKLLGCFSKNEYPGRGYLEALGLGLNPKGGSLCIRGNFATLDSRGNIKDRRAGREETGLEEMCDTLDGVEIAGFLFRVRKSVGHRVAIIVDGKVSDKIILNSPKGTGVPLPQIQARDRSGKKTASVLNKFVYRITKILTNDPINRKRKVPASTILLRSVGMRKETKSFRERYGMKGGVISTMPVANGVARYLGMDVIDAKKARGINDVDLDSAMETTLKALERHDFVLLHINQTDIFGHDRDPVGKKEYIEKIDKRVGELVKSLDMKKTVVCITCDHRTASAPSHKGYEHTNDPVPVLVSGGKVVNDRAEKFDEKHAEKGSFSLEKNDLVKFMKVVGET
jgi:2,3-bisphosphoglycerate-independent phosphoglycerate mutase